MKTLLIILIVMTLSSCTIYRVKSVTAEGKLIKVMVISGRNFEAPDLRYGRDANGDVEFTFKAATVVDGNQAILQAILSGALVVPK